ncbi:hypothetical protein DOZ69_17820 [Pseudomonas fluorescens]|nr:hypothetical protein DOZ69_17820 [Pseudomonas fluorescens]
MENRDLEVAVFFCADDWVLIVPTLCVGMPQGTLRVPTREFDAERQGLHSRAERGNDQSGAAVQSLFDASSVSYLH